MVDLDNCVFIDIDTQKDFIEPDGALYVPDGEKLKPAFQKVLTFAREHDVPIVGSVDAHSEDDPEFEQFPPHCIQGTEGQKKVPESRMDDIVFIPSEPLSEEALEERTKDATAVYFEKQQLSVVEGNPNFLRYLEKLGRDHAVVFGVTTEFCVKEAAEGLRKNGYAVDVLADVVEAVEEEEGENAVREMKEMGIGFQPTRKLIPDLSV